MKADSREDGSTLGRAIFPNCKVKARLLLWAQGGGKRFQQPYQEVVGSTRRKGRKEEEDTAIGVEMLGAGAMTQWLRALALAGDPGWTQDPHGGSQPSPQVHAI